MIKFFNEVINDTKARADLRAQAKLALADNSSVEGGCVRDYLTGEHIKKLGMNGVLHFT